jgi:hypothetical protein
MKRIFLSLSCVALLATVGCKKDYLETTPSDGVTKEQIFGQINTVYAAVNGATKVQFAYSYGATTGRHDAFGQKSYDLASDLMGNDMVFHQQGYGWFTTAYNYTEWLNPNINRHSDLAWYLYYDLIKQANSILAIIDYVEDATQDEKEAIKGEALGIRAYCYYYLINYFQQTYKGHETAKGVPMYLEVVTDGAGRGTVQEVYDQIVSDLTTAEGLLVGKPRVDKTHIDVSTVRGFRARVALLQEDWATAASYAAAARQGYTLMTGSQYKMRNAFSSIDNPEWMWGSYIPEEEATVYASFFSHMDASVDGYAGLGTQKRITKELYDKIATGDARKDVFIAPGTGTGALVDYCNFKHLVPVPGSWSADYLYMRASEMYLIEAEALARQAGQEAAARTALETVVQARYPAYSAASLSGSALLEEILTQRRIELWGEGFSLIDVKRLGNGLNRPSGAGNHGAPSFNPGVYTTGPADARFLMRIPLRELNSNGNMDPVLDQNP